MRIKLIIFSLLFTLFYQPVETEAADYVNYKYWVAYRDSTLKVITYDASTSPMKEIGVQASYDNVRYGDELTFKLYCNKTLYVFQEYDSNGKELTISNGRTQTTSAQNCSPGDVQIELSAAKDSAGNALKVNGTTITRADGSTTKPDPKPEPTPEPDPKPDPSPPDPEPTDPPDATDPDPKPDPDPNPGEPEPDPKPEPDPAPEWCDPECRIFRCPQWESYMGKLDDIKNAIPPAPNWDQVAETFKDKIVPALMDEVKDYFGSVGDPPAPPPDLPKIDDKNILDRTPVFNDVPELDNAGFDSTDIKNQAPVIEERPDESGGFDLSVDPIESLPEVPNTLEPGKTENKDWMNKPNEPSNSFPDPPKGSGNVDIGKPPIPGGNTDSAPMPDTGGGNAPTPGGSGGSNDLVDYKPSPTAPDGSGGIIRP